MDAKPPSRPPHMLLPEIPPYQVTVNPRQQTSHTANLTQELSGLAHAQASLHTAASRPTRSSPRGLCSLGRKRRGFRLLLHRPELGPKGRCRWEPLSHGPLPELARTVASALTRARGTAWPIKVAQEDQRLVALLASRQSVREWLEALPRGGCLLLPLPPLCLEHRLTSPLLSLVRPVEREPTALCFPPTHFA